MLALVMATTVAAAESAADRQPPIKDLGGGRYQVGEIIIDKANGHFRVPGKVIRTEPPLEFLAVTKGGYKAYESVLELEVDAFEFNLACILIGLDAEGLEGAEYHFDTKPLEGERVEMELEWQREGESVSVSAAELLVEGEGGHPSSDWVYTGSTFLPDGRYMAQLDGVLIGFIHSPASVIEHKIGVGLGNYGSVATSNKLPPLDTPVHLIVKKGER